MAGMARADRYNDLMFRLGDLARERLADRPSPPRSMARVFKAEEGLVAQREALEELEREMNDEDEGYKAFLDLQQAERAEQEEITAKWKRAVEGIEAQAKEVRRRLSSKRAAARYDVESLRKAEALHEDLELAAQHDPKRVGTSRENVKRLRLIALRKQRELEELEADLKALLTPRPGQLGAEGILAHRRLLEMDDEAEARKLELERTMARFDQAIAAKEEELGAAEDYLDQALFLLGEECYGLRVADPALAALYDQLDQAG